MKLSRLLRRASRRPSLLRLGRGGPVRAGVRLALLPVGMYRFVARCLSAGFGGLARFTWLGFGLLISVLTLPLRLLGLAV